MNNQTIRELNRVIHNSLVYIHPQKYAVVQLASPPSIDYVFCLAQDKDEVTAIMEECQLQNINFVYCEKSFRLIEVAVAKPFVTVGFLAQITTSMAESGINVLVVSTFSKDYILIRWDVSDKAICILKSLGFAVEKAQ